MHKTAQSEISDWAVLIEVPFRGFRGIILLLLKQKPFIYGAYKWHGTNEVQV